MRVSLTMFCELDFNVTSFFIAARMHERGQQMLFIFVLFVNVFPNIKLALLNYFAFYTILLLGFIFYLSNVQG